LKSAYAKVTIAVLIIFSCSSAIKAHGPENASGKYGKQIPITGNTDQLKYFFNALKESKTKKIRIAHYGDSIIQGDVLSENIRERMQKLFGGNGAGFISINTEDYGMRKTSTLSFSDDWKEASLFKRNPEKMPLGLNGAVCVPNVNSWAKFETSRYSKTLKSFSTVRLFYSNAAATSQIKYTFNNGAVKTANLKSGLKLNELLLNQPNATSFKFEFISGQKPFMYGVSLENGNGVYVDNFPLKGNSGVTLLDIPANVLKEFNALMNYKLLIINFGPNVISAEHVTYTWYEEKMEKVIRYFQEAFPQTSILIVSIGDKGIKKGTKFITDPGVKNLLEAQKNLARKTNVAFWNLYEAMGAENSILDWVDAKPALAYKDYTHFTPEGGEVVGDLLTDALMNLYNQK